MFNVSCIYVDVDTFSLNGSINVKCVWDNNETPCLFDENTTATL